VTTSPPVPVRYYLGEERYLTELEFDQAVTKPPETYP
ncbi:unnamed protein product, partial [Rotaria socialis]